MLVLGPIGDEEQQTRRGKPVDQAIEPRLRLRIDPVQVLEDQQHRLAAALAEDEARESLERVLATLAGLELRPPRAPDRHAEKRFESRHGGPRILADFGQPAADLRPHLGVALAIADSQTAS